MQDKNLKIKVIGIGGGGQQVVDYLYLSNKCENREFIVINSDEPFLNLAKTKNKYVLSGEYYNDNGESLGCGGDPEVGKEYAIRHIDKISEIVGKPDVVFLVASFGGGCGTGVTPVIAEMLNELGVKTIAIIGKPFHWEGEMRKQRTIDGIEKLKQYVEKSIIIDYQSLSKAFPPNTSLNAGWNYIYEKVAEEFYKTINCLY